jgi:hypothetical protein
MRKKAGWMHGPETVRDGMKGYTARNIYSHLESDDSGTLDHPIRDSNEAPFMRKRVPPSTSERITRPIVRKHPHGVLGEKGLGSFWQHQP